MIGKLAAKDSRKARPFEPQIHQNRGRDQNRGYNQRSYQNRYRSDNRWNSRNRQFRQDRGGNRFEQSYRRNSRENPRNYGRQNSYRNDNYARGRNRSRDRLFSRNYDSNRARSTSNSRLMSGFRASTNRDIIRCYRCREYDHFMRDCPNSREERELEQLQQMLNLEENQTHLLMNSQNSRVESPRVSPLNL